MTRFEQCFESYQKCLKVLKRVIEEYKSTDRRETTEIALVHTFQLAFELAWKLLKKYEEEQGIILNSPKEVIREAFNLGIIDNSDNVWFKMLEGRNIGAHQYDDNTPVLLLDVIADKYSNVLYNLEDFFRNSNSL